MDPATVMDTFLVNPPALRQALLQWWKLHGRHTIPWKLSPSGGAPLSGEILNPYAIWVTEAMPTLSTYVTKRGHR